MENFDRIYGGAPGAAEIGARLFEEVYDFAISRLADKRADGRQKSGERPAAANEPTDRVTSCQTRDAEPRAQTTDGSPAEPTSRPADTSIDDLLSSRPVADTAQKVRDAVDRDKLEGIAEKLNRSADSGFLGITLPWSKSEDRAGLVKDLSDAELEVLDGIYHKKYGTTLRTERGLKGDERFRDVLDRDKDPVARKAGRLMDLLDEQSGSSNVHSSRVQKLCRELSDMNCDEIQQVNSYFKNVYGISLRDAINTNSGLSSTTREMCAIYLSGKDQLDGSRKARLEDLEEKERQAKMGNPDPDLKPADLEDLFLENFSDLDRNKDGFIDKDEIDRAMADDDYKGKNAQLIAVLKEKRKDLEELSNDEWGDEDDGITKADMKEFAKLVRKSDKSNHERKLVLDIEHELSRSGTVLQKYGDASIWGAGEDPMASINPDAVQQGRVGDCYFLAALASMSSTPEGKQTIKNMIEYEGGGSYKVTFPGDADHPVTVDAPTPSELAHAAEPTKHGMWVSVLEKAYAKRKDKDSKAPYEAIDGGTGGDALEILTGKSTDRDFLTATSLDTTHEKLTAAIRDHRFVTAGIRPEVGESWGWADGKTDDAGLPTQHEYSIVGYNPETRMVKIRNPWGCGTPDAYCSEGKADDGTFEMSLKDFDKNFTDITYTEEE